METLSFTLGVLSVIAVILVTVIVIGIVKVVKQQEQIKSINSELESVWNGQNHNSTEIHQLINQNQQDMFRSIDEVRSYVDSRVDKLISSKQVIKG